MQLIVRLNEEGEALMERVAELADGLAVVVDGVEQGPRSTRIRVQGERGTLATVAERAVGASHVIQRVELYGESHVAWLSHDQGLVHQPHQSVRGRACECECVVWVA